MLLRLVDLWSDRCKYLQIFSVTVVEFMSKRQNLELWEPMPLRQLDGVLTKNSMYSTGCVKTHGDLTGVNKDSSEYKWDNAILMTVLILVNLTLIKLVDSHWE